MFKKEITLLVLIRNDILNEVVTECICPLSRLHHLGGLGLGDHGARHRPAPHDPTSHVWRILFTFQVKLPTF